MIMDYEKKYKESEDELKWLTQFIQEEAYYLSMDIRGDEDRIKLKNLQRSLTWLENQVEQTPVDDVEIFEKDYKEFNDFERTLVDVCMGWIGIELGWKKYIKNNADELLKLAIKNINSARDVPFEQNLAWIEEDERIRKALIRLHKSTIEVDGIKGEDIIAWLEKQGKI